MAEQQSDLFGMTTSGSCMCMCLSSDRVVQNMDHTFLLPIFIPSWELKLVKLAGRDKQQLLKGDSMTSGSPSQHKSWPLLIQQRWRVTVCRGHHHRKMSGAKRDTYPNTPSPLPPPRYSSDRFYFEVKAAWYVLFKPTSAGCTIK